VTVVLVMEDSLYRQGLSMLLESSGSVGVVAQGERIAEVTDGFGRGVPNVVLIDIITSSEGLDISDVLACRKATPASRIVVISDDMDAESVLEVFEAGAHGYVLRGSQASVLVDAVRSAARGEYVVDSRVTGALLRTLRELRRRLELYGVGDPQIPLTARQRELLRLVSEGMTNRQIASELGISESTVKNHLHHVFARLGVASRSQAIAVGVRLGLVKP
jgi:DNA-binding NarL/FixJ family response regulator